MANDWSGLDAMNANFIEALRDAAQKAAIAAEDYGKQHQRWNNDTGSLVASLTGYEAKEGDPRANFNDENWQAAQRFGSQKYGTPPEHYLPFAGWEESIPDDEPTCVISVWTKYPQDGNVDDDQLMNAVEDTLFASATYVAGELVGHMIEDSLRFRGGQVTP